ncbi:MAG TPA: SpoIIIAH-like family protein [Clostridiales bacterium]|jgi:stage III sporulation protein AH|nr:SpoIIIAH-like family protein [Clostridiales bacterium]
MKNIFKKNQIIITALAIMIVIAGYLSFTRDDKPEDPDSFTTSNQEDYENFSELDGMDVATDTGDVNGDLTNDPNNEDDVNTTDENDETVPVDTDENADDDTYELGDISDEDILQAAQDVTDNGELNLEEGVPGEAVLTSTTLDAGFFITNRMEREQLRAKNQDKYLQILNNPDLSEELKADAVQAMLELTEVADMENATEIALEAKGFDDVIVSIYNGKADVIVNAPSLSDQQLAIIESVVKDRTEFEVANITISPVILEE